MASCIDLGYQKVLRRPLVLANNKNNIIPGYCAQRPTGFYELFDTEEKSFKPSSKRVDGSYGYEKIWRPARAKVEGAGISSLGSNMTSRLPESWRPSIKYIDPGSGTWIYDRPWRPSKKQVIPLKEQLSNEEVQLQKCSRKKFIMAKQHPNGSEWPSPKGHGMCIPHSEWEPPFRKGNNDDLKPIKHPRRHLPTYRNDYESRGVRAMFDPKCPPSPIGGKRRLPTYRNEQMSSGVGAALKFPDYHPAIML